VANGSGTNMRQGKNLKGCIRDTLGIIDAADFPVDLGTQIHTVI
jgi:hypothetical protein